MSKGRKKQRKEKDLRKYEGIKCYYNINKSMVETRNKLKMNEWCPSENWRRKIKNKSK